MRWFRANRSFGGGLALFALVVQLMLSFGHIHREDIFGAANAASGGTSIAAPAADASQPVPHQRHSKHADDYCAICATIHLLGSSFAAAAPQLVSSFASHAIEHFVEVAAVFVPPQRTFARLRAGIPTLIGTPNMPAQRLAMP